MLKKTPVIAHYPSNISHVYRGFILPDFVFQQENGRILIILPADFDNLHLLQE